jgi:hypothetical protein
MTYAFEPDVIGITAGSIDTGSYKGKWPKLEQHIFLEEKAPWETTLADDGAARHQTSSVVHLIKPTQTSGKRRRSE